jgi:hypothetical protein
MTENWIDLFPNPHVNWGAKCDGRRGEGTPPPMCVCRVRRIYCIAMGRL